MHHKWYTTNSGVKVEDKEMREFLQISPNSSLVRQDIIILVKQLLPQYLLNIVLFPVVEFHSFPVSYSDRAGAEG